MPKRRKGARRHQLKLKSEESTRNFDAGSENNNSDDDDDDDDDYDVEDNIRSQNYSPELKRGDSKTGIYIENDYPSNLQRTNRLSRFAASTITRKIKIRSLEDSAPRSRVQRRWEQIKRLSQNTSVAAQNSYRKQSYRPQYRITAATEAHKNTDFCGRLKHCLGCWSGSRFDAFTYDSVVGSNPNAFCWGFDINRMIAAYLSWSFRASFFVLFLSLNIGFFCLIILFTFIMMLVGESYPECFVPTYNEAQTPFADAYALSWTTFTTVGYGHTYPAKGEEEPDQHECFILHILCSFESFVGVIWAGCCGAIIFGKILRVQSLAPIVFSDPITVQYGKGLKKEDTMHGNESPFPVLTIRMANLRGDQVGGEVVDGLVHLVAITNESGDDLPKRKRRPSVDEENVLNDKDDPGVRSNIRRTFQKLTLDNVDNPYFKRVWTVNHELNYESPLLVPRVKEMIKARGGTWPEELNSAERVRDSILFDQLFVSFSGISVVCADSVYAQHMYNYEDMNIGYKFVPMLYKGRDGIIRADLEILNDVVEQRYGGGESLMFDDVKQNYQDRVRKNQSMNGYNKEDEESSGNELNKDGVANV